VVTCVSKVRASKVYVSGTYMSHYTARAILCPLLPLAALLCIGRLQTPYARSCDPRLRLCNTNPPLSLALDAAHALPTLSWLLRNPVSVPCHCWGVQSVNIAPVPPLVFQGVILARRCRSRHGSRHGAAAAATGSGGRTGASGHERVARLRFLQAGLPDER